MTAIGEPPKEWRLHLVDKVALNDAALLDREVISDDDLKTLVDTLSKELGTSHDLYRKSYAWQQIRNYKDDLNLCADLVHYLTSSATRITKKNNFVSTVISRILKFTPGSLVHYLGHFCTQSQLSAEELNARITKCISAGASQEQLIYMPLIPTDSGAGTSTTSNDIKIRKETVINGKKADFNKEEDSRLPQDGKAPSDEASINGEKTKDPVVSTLTLVTGGEVADQGSINFRGEGDKKQLGGKIHNVFLDSQEFRPEDSEVAGILEYGLPIVITDYKLINDISSNNFSIITLEHSESDKAQCRPLIKNGINGYSISTPDYRTNIPYINAALLRIKLLGTVVAIKREISSILMHQYNKNQPSPSKNPSLFQRALNLIAGDDAPNKLDRLKAFGLYVEHWLNIASTSALPAGWPLIGMVFAVFILSSLDWLDPHLLPWHFILINPAIISAWSSIVLAIVFMMVGMNLKKIEDREAIHKHEEIVEQLKNALSRITQFNLSVQVGNVDRGHQANPGNYTPLPESYIRSIDLELNTRESINSLESTIKARLNAVDSTIHHINESQHKSRRMVMAAGGAVFTGFFAHEVGMSILEYIHLENGNDPKSFFFWNSNKLGTEAKSHMEVKTVLKDGEFQDNFIKHELEGTGMVLIFTLLFTIMAALLAIRKSPNDSSQGGQQGHH